MRPAEGGGGGRTNFAGMTHEQMLKWLNEASSYNVGAAAQRLKAVSEQMAKIADDLRARMRNMDWEGEAEKAFVEWATNVANSTTALADYSARGAGWMEENSTAIAAAQSAMPPYTSHESAKANLEAAIKAKNDPDAKAVATDARASMAASEQLEAIKAKEAANHQAAVDEMLRLSQTYQWSSSQMRGEDPPTFPPPPGTFVPDNVGDRYGSEYIGSTQQSDSRSTGTDTGTTQPSRTRHDVPAATPDRYVPPAGDKDGPTYTVRPEVRPDVLPEVRPDEPVDLGIDSVNTLPPPTTTGPGPSVPGPQPPLAKPDGITPPFVTTGIPPFTGKGGTTPLPPTAPTNGGARSPLTNGGLRGLATGPGPLGGSREGISGGRAVPSTQAGRPATGIPRSTVIGAEQGGRGAGLGRAPMAGGMGAPMGGAMGAGQSGVTGGRRLAGETGGVVGGRPQATGAAGGRPFTPGGSGLVRGGSTPTGEQREEPKGERPDYLVEDEETWQQRNRRVAPPVID